MMMISCDEMFINVLSFLIFRFL